MLIVLWDFFLLFPIKSCRKERVIERSVVLPKLNGKIKYLYFLECVPQNWRSAAFAVLFTLQDFPQGRVLGGCWVSGLMRGCLCLRCSGGQCEYTEISTHAEFVWKLYASISPCCWLDLFTINVSSDLNSQSCKDPRSVA